MRALLVSTYDLGRQPFGLASPAAWLRAAGWEVVCVDLAKERWDDGRLAGAALVGFHLPMHTATRLAGPLIQRVRTLDPAVRLCAYGLYAPLNDVCLFNGVKIDPEVHTLVWPNGADFDPATLHDWPIHAQALHDRAQQWQRTRA